jgi:hypothetical protein
MRTVLPVDYPGKRRDACTDQYAREDQCRGSALKIRMPVETPVEPFIPAFCPIVSGPDLQGPGRFGIQAFHRGTDQIRCYEGTVIDERERAYTAAYGLARECVEVLGHREELVGWHDLFSGS